MKNYKLILKARERNALGIFYTIVRCMQNDRKPSVEQIFDEFKEELEIQEIIKIEKIG